MRTRTVLPFVALGVMVLGCERRTAAPGTGADSTATADSTAADSAAGDTSKSAMVQPKVPSDSIIGHDSAFGPIGSVDSTGKLVPLRPKRP